MAGSSESARKAAITKREKYGKDFFSNMAKKRKIIEGFHTRGNATEAQKLSVEARKKNANRNKGTDSIQEEQS